MANSAKFWHNPDGIDRLRNAFDLKAPVNEQAVMEAMTYALGFLLPDQRATDKLPRLTLATLRDDLPAHSMPSTISSVFPQGTLSPGFQKLYTAAHPDVVNSWVPSGLRGNNPDSAEFRQSYGMDGSIMRRPDSISRTATPRIDMRGTVAYLITDSRCVTTILSSQGVIKSRLPDVAFTSWLVDTFNVSDPRLYMAMLYAFENGAWGLWCEDGVWIIAMRPTICLDDRKRLHNKTGAAVTWLGESLYYLDGVNVPPAFVLAPDTLNYEDIMNERNAERRRIAMNLVGYNGILRDNPAAGEVASDEFGTIWMLPSLPWERETLYLLEVINSTPEGLWQETGEMVMNPFTGKQQPERVFCPELGADGKLVFKKYVLRFDPNVYNGDTQHIPRAAAASLVRFPSGELEYEYWQEYKLFAQT